MEVAASIKKVLEEKLSLPLKWVKVSPGTKAGDNYMSTIHSLELLEEEETLRQWVIKCYPSHPIRQEFANKTNMFFKELFVYKEWIPELLTFQKHVLKINKPLTLPIAVFVGGACLDYRKESSTDTNGNTKIYQPMDNFLVLEDLRKQGYQMADRQLGLDYPHCKLVVEELAKYHALTWAYKSSFNLPSIAQKFPLLEYSMDSEDLQITADILKNSVTLAKAALDSHFGKKDCPLSLRLAKFSPHCQTIMKVFYDASINEKELDCLCGISSDNTEPLWRVLVHGDDWINNFLFQYGNTSFSWSSWTSSVRPCPEKVAFIDHAVARELCPTVELAYMIYTSTTFALRKNYLEDLLNLYYEAFLKNCVFLGVKPLPSFSLDLLKRKFHRAKLYGFTIALLALPMFLKSSSDIIDLDQGTGEEGQDYADLMNRNMLNYSKINPIFKKRIVEMVQEMVQDGIL